VCVVYPPTSSAPTVVHGRYVPVPNTSGLVRLPLGAGAVVDVPSAAAPAVTYFVSDAGVAFPVGTDALTQLGLQDVPRARVPSAVLGAIVTGPELSVHAASALAGGGFIAPAKQANLGRAHSGDCRGDHGGESSSPQVYPRRARARYTSAGRHGRLAARSAGMCSRDFNEVLPMTEFTVIQSEMARGKGYVQDASAKVKSYLNTLERDVEELLPGWQSGGSRSFASAHRSWTEKSMTIVNALDDLGEKLGVVGTTTGQGDESVSTSFAKFGS
jgi:uncharacterized protein YukE